MAARDPRTTGERPSSEDIRRLGLPERGRRTELSRAFLILGYAHDSATALLAFLRTVRDERAGTRGRLTDEEQDLLRAMLVMSAAGLDAMVKQLIRDALPLLCLADERVRVQFIKFTSRRIRRDGEGHLTGEVSELLAKALTSRSPQSALVEEYIQNLTGASLQSVEELFKIGAALGIDGSVIDRFVLEPIFEDRNRIIHELDIDFGVARGNRRIRPRAGMIESSNRLLFLAERFYLGVEERLSEGRPGEAEA